MRLSAEQEPLAVEERPAEQVAYVRSKLLPVPAPRKEKKNPKMTAENMISANLRMGRPPFDCCEWVRERITEKYGMTAENEVEVALRILAEEDARWGGL
jgi:hypothetical protein